MRLPVAADSGPARIDPFASIGMIRYAIDHGVNYLDAGFPWDMQRHAEIAGVVGKALQDGYRAKTRVAVHLPAPLLLSPTDLDLSLNKQREWLGIDRIDFCLVGRLNRDNWPRLTSLGLLEWIDEALKDGRIDRAGFSFHDHYQVLRGILDSYDKWTVCQFQYSYMDIDHNPGTSGINYAADRGLAVVVTEALRGGRLTKPPPEAVARVWAESGLERSPAEWALRFVWNHAAVSTAVCDASSIEQLAENLEIAEDGEPESLTVQEEVLISRVREEYHKHRVVPCPSCRPCMPCPEGIDVPRFFQVYNDAIMYDDLDTARSICRDEQLHPEACIECGVCEGRCAKRLPIIDWLRKARVFLGIGQ